MNLQEGVELFKYWSHTSEQGGLSSLPSRSFMQFAAHVIPHHLLADKQVMKLLGYQNVAYIVPEGSYVGGQRLTKRDFNRGVMLIEQNECEAAVMSILVGGAGLNCQSMNSIIFMGPLTSNYQIKQAKGNSF